MPLDFTTYLYRAWDNDVLLYIGVTGHWPTRAYHHSLYSPWFSGVTHVDLEKHQTFRRAALAERVAIRRELPRYNVQHNPQALHRIRDCPVRMALFEKLWRDGEYPDKLTDAQVVAMLNAVEGSALPIMKSVNSLSNWRKDGFKGWELPE